MTLGIWFILSYLYGVGTTSDCSRSLSRIVRNVFMQKIEPEYARLSLHMPNDCPFHIERDMYGYQEQYKEMESVGRWTCLFCGKSFYDEQYLDKHFDNKHLSKTPQDGRATCLANFCDIFRCDIITGRVVAQYWDRALCKESELDKLMDKCQHVLSSCIPKDFHATPQSQLFGLMNTTICSYLTCDRYWENSEMEVSAAYTALYITAAVFILFGVLIYYFVAYSHFFTDESLLDGPRHRRRSHGSIRSNKLNRDNNIRFRSNTNSNAVW